MSAVGVRNFGSFQVPGSSLVFQRDTGRQAYKRVLEVASGCEYGTRLHHPPSSSSSPRLRYGATLVGPPDLLPHFPFGPLRLRPPSYEKLGLFLSMTPRIHSTNIFLEQRPKITIISNSHLLSGVGPRCRWTGRTGRREELAGDAFSGPPRRRTGSSRHLPPRQGSSTSRRHRGI